MDAAEALGGDQEDVFNYVVTRFPSAYANKVAMQDLIRNLYEAGSSTDLAAVLGRALLCEWAST